MRLTQKIAVFRRIELAVKLCLALEAYEACLGVERLVERIDGGADNGLLASSARRAKSL